MIKSLNLSWRKGGNEPTASELNKLVAKVNEIVYAANNGFEYTAGGDSSSSSFDWTSIPSASIYSRGLMTPEMVEKLNNVQTPTIDVITEVLGDYYVKTEYVIKKDAQYNADSNNPISAWYANEYFVQLTTYKAFLEDLERWKQTVPSLSANNTFTGNNTFSQVVTLNGGFLLDNVKVTNIHTSKEEPENKEDENPSVYSLTTSGHVSTHYLRKDKGNWDAFGDYTFKDEEKEYFRINKDKVTFDYLESYGAVEPLNDFFGSGVVIKNDSVGNGYIYTDELHVRKTAWFRNVTIEETKHIGGETILSCAYCVIEMVVPVTIGEKSYFVCFFAKEANGKEAYQMWEKGDQARLQQSSATKDTLKSRYYWRVVTDCGDGTDIGSIYPTLTATPKEEADHNGTSKLFGSWCEDYYFVVLSDNDIEDLGDGYVLGAGKDQGSCEPLANDEIVLLGNRNLDPSKNKRRAAQLYSTMQENSPLRKYYTGIGIYNENGVYYPFSFKESTIETMEYTENDGSHWEVGKGGNFIRFTESGGLEASLTSLSIIAGDSTTNVVEALGQSFRIWTKEITWYAKDFGYPQKIAWSNVIPSKDWKTKEERETHFGDCLVTVDGFAYEFYDDVWNLTADQYLILANKIAEEAKDSLYNIASDSVVTRQEKNRLRQILQEITAEHSNIIAESTDVSTTNYECAFLMFSHFLNVLLLDPADVYLVKETKTLCVNRDGVVGYSEGYAPNENTFDFSHCYSYYYEQAAELRRQITTKVLDRVGNVSETLTKKIDDDVSGLVGRLDNLNDGLLEVNKDLSALMNAAKGEDGVYFSGFVTNGEYAAMTSNLYAKDKDGNILNDSNGKPITLASAMASTFIYVVGDDAVSGYMINADKILFNGNVGIQGLTYRLPSTPKGFSDSTKIFNGFTETNPYKPQDENIYDFYKVSVYCDSGIKGESKTPIGMYAFNLAKTGSFINLEDYKDNVLYFLLPCCVNRNRIANRYDTNNAMAIIEFFREQAYKYLGNTIVIKLPWHVSIQFEASEYGIGGSGEYNVLPLSVGKGICVPEDYNNSGDFVYGGAKGLVNTESAWIMSKKKPSTMFRYVVLTSKFLMPKTHYITGEITEGARTNVLGWEIALFDDYIPTLDES